MDIDLATETLKQRSIDMDLEGLLVSERIDEIMMMCGRENPIYEQISNFSIALYTLGFFDCPDLLSLEDVDAQEATVFLNEEFTQIKPEDLPLEYCITESRERYLLVVGDPLFPIHFAVFTDARSPRPFFSKLPFFGCGFDSLEELIGEFVGIDGIGREDIHYFKKNCEEEIQPPTLRKIYIIK